MGKQDLIGTFIIIIFIIIIILLYYLKFKTNMDLASHYGLKGLEYWYYVLTMNW